ncbi:Vesicle transport v-SNARE 13, partial [Tetrabaena socialis]
ELGTGILANLASQRETIIRSRDTLHGADDDISSARRILSGMSRRIMQNKLIMVGIIGVLLAGIILIVYFKLK